MIPEHARVEAIKEIHDGDGLDDTVPVGATGTVVGMIKHGLGYFVEFTKPVHLVVIAEPDEIEEIKNVD